MGFTSFSVSAAVFPDTYLQTCVDAAVVSSGVATAEDLTSLTCFPNLGLSDLTGIEALVNLESLTIYGTSVHDYSKLATLTGLTYLNLQWNMQDVDVSPLRHLVNLQTLNLSVNNIPVHGNLKDLVSLTSATSINLDGNAAMSCVDLQILIDNMLPGVVSPSVATAGVTCKAGIPVADLVFPDPALQACVDSASSGAVYAHDVTGIYCPFVGISDVSGMEKMSGLTYLSFYYNNIVDVTPLKGLRGLTVLELDYNNVSIGVRELDDLTNLTFFGISGNMYMSCADLDYLKGIYGSILWYQSYYYPSCTNP